jgi:hypothetical protein
MVTLGPGTLQIGTTGSEIDLSCLVNNVRITVDKSQDDARYKLCGTATPGAITYTFALSGNLDTDVDDADGFFIFSQDNAGQQFPFTFTPNTAAGTSAAGTLIVDPVEFGADNYGDPLDSDFEFTILGKPTYTVPTTP